MVSEKDIERKCARLAKEKGFWMPKWTSPGTSGVPDRILFGLPWVVFIEFKAPGKKPARLQEHYLELIKSYGHEAVVIDNLDDFETLLNTGMR